MFKRFSKRGKRGQGIVELALVLPVILALSTGAFDLARIRQDQAALDRAAQSGVNFATKLGKNFEPPTDAEVREEVRNSLLPPLRSSDIEDEDIIINRVKIGGQDSVSIQIRNDVKPFLINWAKFGGGVECDTYPTSAKAILPMQQFTIGSGGTTIAPGWTIDEGVLTTNMDAHSNIKGADFGGQYFIHPTYCKWQVKEDDEIDDNNWTDFKRNDALANLGKSERWLGSDDKGGTNTSDGYELELVLDANGDPVQVHGDYKYHINDGGTRINRSWTDIPPVDTTFVIESESDDPRDIIFMGDCTGGYVNDVLSTSGNCRMYKNGDAAPTNPGANQGQGSAAEFLADKIDDDGNFVLGDNDVVILWDFNELSHASYRLDWNDLVMVIEMKE